MKHLTSSNDSVAFLLWGAPPEHVGHTAGGVLAILRGSAIHADGRVSYWGNRYYAGTAPACVVSPISPVLSVVSDSKRTSIRPEDAVTSNIPTLPEYSPSNDDAAPDTPVCDMRAQMRA